MKRLIAELNDFLAKHDAEFKMIKKSEQRAYIISKLTKENSDLYASLPEGVARQLSLDRDPHGNVQVSLIETEKLLSRDGWQEVVRMEGREANTSASSPHSTTSSVTKAVAPLRPITMRTTATLWVIRHLA